MKILVVDPALDVGEQLRQIAKDTGYSLIDLSRAWNEKHPTQPVSVRDFTFDLIPEPDKVDERFLEKRLSYKAQQKQLPKFLKPKRR